MVTNKYITKIISVLMALAVILCFVASSFSGQLQAVYGNCAMTMEYESKLFDTEQIMDIDILMDEDDWNDMLENAISENDARILKNISEGTDLETYMDVDNILKYMAVHTFVVNDDSLSGTMAHNYYLYEYNGQLNILPWDYNLSFGGMSMGGGMGVQSSGATSMINDAIDTPFSITNFFDALLENEEYLARYHEYLNELVEKYVNGREFQKTYERIRSQIDGLVSDDPTAFYSYEEYEAAAQMLLEVVSLRAESVSGQLDGTIPSTDDGQQADSSSLIDGSDIELSVMGTMSGGGGAENKALQKAEQDDVQ